MGDGMDADGCVCPSNVKRLSRKTRGSKRCFDGGVRCSVVWCVCVCVCVCVCEYVRNFVCSDLAGWVGGTGGGEEEDDEEEAWQRRLKGPFFCTPATADPSDLSGLALP